MRTIYFSEIKDGLAHCIVVHFLALNITITFC
jgi:hypothetical protein